MYVHMSLISQSIIDVSDCLDQFLQLNQIKYVSNMHIVYLQFIIALDAHKKNMQRAIGLCALPVLSAVTSL